MPTSEMSQKVHSSLRTECFLVVPSCHIHNTNMHLMPWTSAIIAAFFFSCSKSMPLSFSFNIMVLLMGTFLVPSCQSLCQLHLGMRLFVFISIKWFDSVFINKVPSCICQLQWKARDTTESGSRFNRFHAISTTLRGVCLPLAEERLSHTGGFSSSWYSPTLPGLRMEENEAVASVLSIPRFPPAWWLFCLMAAMRSRWGEVQFTQPGNSQVSCTNTPSE